MSRRLNRVGERLDDWTDALLGWAMGGKRSWLLIVVLVGAGMVLSSVTYG